VKAFLNVEKDIEWLECNNINYEMGMNASYWIYPILKDRI